MFRHVVWAATVLALIWPTAMAQASALGQASVPASAQWRVFAGGSPGSEPGQFRQPFGVAVDISGNVYVADTRNGRIQKFLASGELQLVWGGDFSDDYALGIAPDGTAYVTDTQNHRIQVFSGAGELLVVWGACEGAVSAVGPGGCLDRGQRPLFLQPHGVDLDADGNVYIVSYHRVTVVAPNGAVIRSWGEFGLTEEPGYFGEPAGIALDGSGSVYVADSDNNRIQKFTRDGEFITQWQVGGPPSFPGGRPSGIAVAPGGDIYVTSEDTVLRFSATGERLASYGGAQVHGLAASSNGALYAADTVNHRVLALAGT